MNRYLTPLIFSFSLAAAQTFAREQQSPPSPSGDGGIPQVGTIKVEPNPSGYGTTSFFVGHYGEMIEFPYSWIAEAELRGKTEAVYFHRKFSDDKNRLPFQPKPADYTLENFARLELMELIVIPKNAPGGLRSLKAIRRAKEEEIAKTGADSKIIDETNEYAWPRGTFHVKTLKPHSTVQTYGESPKEFYILTTGGSLAAGDYDLSEERAADYNYYVEHTLESLRKHLLAVHKQTLGDFIYAHSPDTLNFFSFAPVSDRSKDFLSSFRSVRFFGLFGTLGAGILVIAFWPGTTSRVRRARLFGRSLFFFAHLTALIGFLFVYCPISIFGVKWQSAADATFMPVLLIPWISWLAARHLGSVRTNRVLISTAMLAALWTILMVLTRHSEDSLPVEYAVFGNTVLLHLLGLIFGSAFVLAFGPLPKNEPPR